MTRDDTKQRMGRVGVLASLALLIVKASAAALSGSIAVVSDAVNAFLDLLAYTAVYFSMRIHERHPDENHPFGHRRAEPLAGFFFAVIASVLGTSILRDAVMGFFSEGEPVREAPFAAALVGIALAVKGAMAAWYFAAWRSTQSPALRASFVDSRNDVLSSALALSGLLLGGALDEAAAVLIGAWIVYSGVKVGLENVGFLMGKAPDAEIVERIRRVALEVPGITGLNDLRAHYVGDVIHVELHIEIARETTLEKAHDIGVEVRRRLEAVEPVHKAFIHIDPV